MKDTITVLDSNLKTQVVSHSTTPISNRYSALRRQSLFRSGEHINHRSFLTFVESENEDAVKLPGFIRSIFNSFTSGPLRKRLELLNENRKDMEYLLLPSIAKVAGFRHEC